MGAGQPNWQRLHEMGKLPKTARGSVPMLKQLDKAEALLQKIQAECCEACREQFFAPKKK